MQKSTDQLKSLSTTSTNPGVAITHIFKKYDLTVSAQCASIKTDLKL